MNILDVEMLRGDIVWDEAGYYRYDTHSFFDDSLLDDDPVSDEELEFLEKGNITLLPEAMNKKFLNDCSVYRRPYYVWRGNKVSRDTAYRFITATNDYNDACMDNTMGAPGLLSCFGSPHHYPNNYGVCHPDGNQILNGILWKYEEYYNIIETIALLAEAFPEMCYVFSILNYNETPVWFYDDPEDKWRHWMYEIKKEDIDISFHVHDGMVEMINAGSAIRLVHEFEKLYTREELELCDAMESQRYYERHPEDVNEYLNWLEENKPL